MQGRPRPLPNSVQQVDRGVHIRATAKIRIQDPSRTESWLSHPFDQWTVQSPDKSLQLRFVCFLTAVFRYGEALHPGPKHEGFVLGILNPTGLLHKADQINRLPQGTLGTV